MEQTAGAILAIVFGALSIGVAVYHESTWRKRFKNEIQVPGVIVGDTKLPDEIETYWIIEYRFNGETRSFTSGYSSGLDKPGANVVVMCNKSGENPEHFKWSDRWLFTVGPALFGVCFVCAGALSLIKLR